MGRNQRGQGEHYKEAGAFGLRPAAYLLILCTPPTRDGLDDLDLFAATGVLDKMPDVHDAISAGVGVILDFVVVAVGLRYSGGVHEGCSLWAVLREAATSPGRYY